MAYDPLNPFDLVQYDTRSQQLRQQYGNGLAQNTYQRTQLGIQNQRSQDQLGQQFYDYRQTIPGGFAARGLINSGLYQHALEQYSQRKLQGQQDLQFNYAQGLGNLDIQRLGLEGTLSGGLSGIEAEKQARRAQLASQLRELA